MSGILDRFACIAEGLAGLSGYPYAERHSVWLERLQVNLPELQTFESLPDFDCSAYQAPAAGSVQAGGAALSAQDKGIAGAARRARQHPRAVADAAMAALALAKNSKDLNAFIQLATEPELQAQADVAAAALRSRPSLPLFGVPVAIKDLMAVSGFRLTGGTQCQVDEPQLADAPAVARLRKAGALIVGTANLHELAYGITSQNPHYGTVGNPVRAGHIAGGSSGGSAAAVAAGIVRASVGTDTAGSIRIPAACCGVVGFKPTYDAVPRHGAFDLGPTLDHIGPITRSVNDAALMFSIMAGMPAAVASPLPSLAGLRVGVPSNYFFDPLASDVAQATRLALEYMRADGAQLVPVTLPDIDRASALQFVTLCSEATDVHWQRLVHQPQSMGSDVRVRLEIGQLFPAIWYTRAQRARAWLAAMIDSAMAEVDVLVTPTLRVTAPASGAGIISIADHAMPLHTAITSLTLPFNLTGMPALTLPCGSGDQGLPVGLQLVCQRGRDWALLAIANRVEAVLESRGIGALSNA